MKLFVFIPFWGFLVLCFGGVILSQVERNNKYRAEIIQMNRELEELTRKAEDLDNRLKYSNSDKFVEKAARDQLGLVYPDEIVFTTD